MYEASGARDPKVQHKTSTAGVFLDIEKAFNTTWHHGLLYKLYKVEFSTSEIKVFSPLFSERKFRVSVEGEMSTPRHMQVGVPQGSILSPTLCNLYKHSVYNSSLCRRHLSVCDRTQGGLCSEKTPARSKLNGNLL
jgi:retron-type reverse transcriptase